MRFRAKVGKGGIRYDTFYTMITNCIDQIVPMEVSGGSKRDLVLFCLI